MEIVVISWELFICRNCFPDFRQEVPSEAVASLIDEWNNKQQEAEKGNQLLMNNIGTLRLLVVPTPAGSGLDMEHNHMTATHANYSKALEPAEVSFVVSQHKQQASCNAQLSTPIGCCLTTVCS